MDMNSLMPLIWIASVVSAYWFGMKYEQHICEQLKKPDWLRDTSWARLVGKLAEKRPWLFS